jgi:GABA permease
VAGIVAVLVQMAFDNTARGQFWLSLLSWAVTVVVYFLAKQWRRRVAYA